VSPFVSLRFLQTQSDDRLLRLAMDGHERAFEALVQRYRKALLAYCSRLLLRPTRAEDAVQQALLQAWMSLQQGTEVHNAKAWLYRIVHNTALNNARSSGYDYAELSESLQGSDAPEADLARRTTVRETLAGIAALPTLQREALLRTAVDGQSHEQVAATLGLTDGAVRGLVYRARVTLRAAATAITPLPLVSWAAQAGRRDAPLGQRLAELGAGSGSVGLAGALAKGGAVVAAAGVVVAGVPAVQSRLHAHPPRAKAAISVDSPIRASFALTPASHGNALQVATSGRRSPGRGAGGGVQGPPNRPGTPGDGGLAGTVGGQRGGGSVPADNAGPGGSMSSGTPTTSSPADNSAGGTPTTSTPADNSAGGTPTTSIPADNSAADTTTNSASGSPSAP
jgi:RNA polymerase sigma factor (sigma-70 family)